MKKLIIDTDPGIDDAMAIQMALNAQELDIMGLTTVFGNVNIDLTTSNALRILDLAGRNDIAVAKGAEHPLKAKFAGGVPFVHGDDGQGNTYKPVSKSSAVELSASAFLVEHILRYPGEVTIAALGPLTNLAMALQMEPQIQQLVKEIVIMGGNAFCAGNATPAAEANMYSDPEAADIVFGADWSLTMVGLDVTHKTVLSKHDIAEISTTKTPLNRHVMEAYKFYQDFFKKANKMDGTYLHDASVIAYLLDRSLYQTAAYPIRVETSDCLGKGKVWPSDGASDQEERPALRPWRNRPLVNVCIDVKGKEVIDLVKSKLML